MTGGDEGRVAETAGEGLLARVDEAMRLEVLQLRERGVAVDALEPALFQVHHPLVVVELADLESA